MYKIQTKYPSLRACILLLLLGMLSGVTLAQQVVVSMKMDTVQMLIGEQLGLTTSVVARPGCKVKFPHFNEGDTLTTGLEVVSQTPVRETSVDAGARRRYETTYYVTAFDSALYSIPGMEVEVDGKAYAAPEVIGLKVGTVPVPLDSLHPDFFFPAFTVHPAPFVVETKWVVGALSGILIVIAMLLVGGRLASRRPLRRRRVIKPQVPPYTEARQAMDALPALESDAPLDGGKAYYVRLTDILRRYLLRRFGIQAPEQTTDETLAAICPYIHKEELDGMAPLLRTADMVKFAGQSSTHQERKMHADYVRNFLDNTRDESMEHPQPIVTMEVLSEGMQWKFRLALWASMVLLVVGGIALILWITVSAWQFYSY